MHGTTVVGAQQSSLQQLQQIQQLQQALATQSQNQAANANATPAATPAGQDAMNRLNDLEKGLDKIIERLDKQ
ncbi:MAG: hypothetical protein IT428_30230 [Planctomycetaceae bacterium]|nr:hypothetical protein [Planctomycetaceae bacterium]